MNITTFYKVYNSILESLNKTNYENETKSLDIYEANTGYCTVIAAYDKMPVIADKQYLALVTRKKHTHTVRGVQAQMLFDLISQKYQETL